MKKIVTTQKRSPCRGGILGSPRVIKGGWLENPSQGEGNLGKTEENPPAPKVARRDSLGAELINSNRPVFTGRTSAGGRGTFDLAGCHKLHGTVTVVTCTFCRSAQGSNFGPTWLQDGATWPQLGPIWEQLRPKVKSKRLPNGRHGRIKTKSSKKVFNGICQVLPHCWASMMRPVEVLQCLLRSGTCG